MQRFIWITHFVSAILSTLLTDLGPVITWGTAGPWWDDSMLLPAGVLVPVWFVVVAVPSGWFERGPWRPGTA